MLSVPLHETAAASPELYVYGPLGLGCIVFAGVVVVLWRALQRQADSHREELREITQRHVEKAESWSASHAKLVQDLRHLLESIVHQSNKP